MEQEVRHGCQARRLRQQWPVQSRGLPVHGSTGMETKPNAVQGAKEERGCCLVHSEARHAGGAVCTYHEVGKGGAEIRRRTCGQGMHRQSAVQCS